MQTKTTMTRQFCTEREKQNKTRTRKI